METAISTLSVLPETREQQHAFANKAIDELMNGNHDLLKVWQQMSIIADTLNEIKESVTLKNAVIAELEKYGKDGKEVNGCKLTVSQRRTFDFSGCNHTAYSILKNEIKARTEIVKELETMLKALKSPMADPETGEVINPPTFTVNEFVTVK